jgi:predicted transposase/invertase (TIGR01784 family)
MPDEPPLHQANDKLFKQVFSDPATAAGFLSAYLPEPIARAVDWAVLTPETGSFIDSQFRRHESDLLFSAPLAGRETFLYCLFEHQTREDPAIALRLLRYMVRIWEARLEKEPGHPLPVILPIVLAQNDRAWKTRPEFAALFDLPAPLSADLRPFLPDFVFRLVQLAEIPFDAIRGTPAGIMVLRVMKAERIGALLDEPVWDEAMLASIPESVFEILLRSVMNADIDTAVVRRNVTLFQSPQLKQHAMSLAQELRQEGRQEGRLQTLRDSVLEVLAVRFGEVPQGLREEIQALGDEAGLQGLHRTAIQCADLEAFSAEL